MKSVTARLALKREDVPALADAERAGKKLSPSTMPPKKTPPKPKTEAAAAATLVLFAKNLDEIGRYYRGATYAGRELGHVVQTELVLGHVTIALTSALEGKSWQAPAHSP